MRAWFVNRYPRATRSCRVSSRAVSKLHWDENALHVMSENRPSGAFVWAYQSGHMTPRENRVSAVPRALHVYITIRCTESTHAIVTLLGIAVLRIKIVKVCCTDQCLCIAYVCVALWQ